MTQKCNLNCIYCYNNWHNNKNIELNYYSIKKIINKLSLYINFSSITLMGGEPLLRKDIFRIVNFLKKTKAIIGISTKAHLLDKKRIKKLINRGVSFFEISLDSIDEKIYYKLTTAKRLNKVIESISYITKYDVECAVTIVITKINYKQVVPIIDLCFDLGVNTIYLSKFIPAGNGIINKEQLSISESEFEEMLESVNERNIRYKMQIGLGYPIKECKINLKKYSSIRSSSCNYKNSKIVIDPQGNLKGCELSPNIIGNLLSEDGEKLLHTLEKNGCSANYDEECLTCKLFNECKGGCNYLKNSLN